jgi:pyruvate-ferredoxin/flavodoxin oxidoreductase
MTHGRETTTIDGNEAVAKVAFKLNEVIAIYPITPSSAMGEWADEWASNGEPNLWGNIPSVVEMQSEAGAAGAVHGALQAGALTTTFTASQGLLLMIPNLYKIAGELTSAVIHVAARSLAAQGLSIFGDHSDVMQTRMTGFGLLSSNSVQEAHDMAAIAQAVTLRSRVPFIHFFDGFRTSHEVSKLELLTDEDLRALIDDDLITEHRNRGLSPDHPVLRGTAQNPDVYFQGRETVNPFYAACPGIVQQVMDQFFALTGRRYQLYQYYGAPDADRVIILMGSGAEATEETVDYLNARGEKVGLLKVHLYRPFDMSLFVQALPKSVRKIAVLDRTKEPGASGEPLYLDTVTALFEEWTDGPMPSVVGGRYGLSSKEFTPAMIKAVYDNLLLDRPKNHFTVGINDDVSNTSLDFDPEFSTEPENVVRAMFYGLGADGTVGANKNSIKIIGENTDNYAQGYFVYDSKKSGSMTISHLRFGPQPIRSTYRIDKANFIACHQWTFLERYDLLKELVPGGVFLLNSPYGPDEVWDHLPRPLQQEIINKKAKFYVINANQVAHEAGMGRRINTIMQTCFFAISGVLPREEAIEQIRYSIRKTYSRKGDEVVNKNLEAVDQTLSNLFEVAVPASVSAVAELMPPVSPNAPAFVRNVLGTMIAQRGDMLPVSAMPIDGTFPTGTAQYEKRNLAEEIPVWDPDICIQCGKCAMVCPHAVIRIKAYDGAQLNAAPETFKAVAARDTEWKGMQYTIQVSPEDCTGCGLCVDVCPAKNKSQVNRKALNMEAQPPLRATESANWDFFLSLPEVDRLNIKPGSIRQQQAQQPLFEFSGACAGCGETPYIKLLTQLFGDHSVIANATGCSSIYGGNLPTTPWSKNADGRGPAWSNSLFEDNAEFGLGMRVALDAQRDMARGLVMKLSADLGGLAQLLLDADQSGEAGILEQRERVAKLKLRLAEIDSDDARRLLTVADALVKRDVWIIGGDGWAYDIGYGGLDHVLSTGRNVNILVLDTEVYSNTGGQASKSTPRGAVAKFAAGGKPSGKKDLGLMAMSYGNVYVARVAMGARDEHTLRCFLEAEAHPGPSIIIAYSHCIAHGIEMVNGLRDQKAAVESGQWLLYRYNPERAEQGLNPLVLDSKAPKIPVKDYMYLENRFRMLSASKPEIAAELLEEAQGDVLKRWEYYEYLASRPFGNQNGDGGKA